MNAISLIQKPRKRIVSIAEALKWKPSGNFVYQLKKDGRFFPQEFGEFGIITEKMKSGILWAHTLYRIGGDDLSNTPLCDTMPVLRKIVPHLALKYPMLKLIPEFSGGEGVEMLFSQKEEGGCAKCLDFPYGEMHVVKRSQVFYTRIIALGEFVSSVEMELLPDLNAETLAQPIGSLQNCGKMPLRSTKYDRVRRGSVLKVEAYSQNESGKLREATPCKDTEDSWLWRY